MRTVSIGYVVHITNLTTGAQWYSGSYTGSPYIYHDRFHAVRYAERINRHATRVADVEEYEYTTGEDNA